MAWYLSRHTGLGYRGLWWSFLVSNGLSVVIASLYYRKGNWKATRLVAPPVGVVAEG